MKRDRRYVKTQFAAPLLLLLASFLAAFFYPLSIWMPAPFAVYLAATAVVSVYACLVHRKPHYVLHVFAIYVVTHLAYGVGQVHGFFAARGSDIR